MPLLLAIHATWRADGVIGLGLLSMMVVIASGVIGRYLYVRIPRARNGVELTREEVARRRLEIAVEVVDGEDVNLDRPGACLLYTSDAADERSSVDLGGRRIIKKKEELYHCGGTVT